LPPELPPTLNPGRRREPGADQFDHLRDNEAVREQERFRAAVGRRREKFERAPPVRLGAATAWHYRPPLPLRRQKLPLDVQPNGHEPFAGFAIASCACCDGTQNEPLDVYPCGQLPPGPEGFGNGKGSANATAVAISSRAAVAAMIVFIGFVCVARPFPSRGGKPGTTCSSGHYWDAGRRSP
jgi:hypothetical protein